MISTEGCSDSSQQFPAVQPRGSQEASVKPRRTVRSDPVCWDCPQRFSVVYMGTYGGASGQWSSCHAGLNKEAKTGSDRGPTAMLCGCVCERKRQRENVCVCLYMLCLLRCVSMRQSRQKSSLYYTAITFHDSFINFTT